MSGHDHSHSHSHGGAPGESHHKRIAIALGITLAVFVFQVIGSILTGSLALLFDSAHVLTDAGGLAMALLAARLMVRPASSKRTWGFARAEVLAATAQAAVLLAVGLVVLVEGIQRLFNPTEIASQEMIWFGAIGLLGNIISMFVLMGGRNKNFNMRAAFLEVLNDALGSVAVIVAAIIISTTGWLQADAIVAMLIGALILPRTVKLLLETIHVLLESTPSGLDLDEVRKHILGLDHVRSVHDLHASQIATGLPILSAHVVVDDECFHDGHAPQMLDALQSCVAGHFAVSIEHSTFQLEPESHAEHELGAHH
ncbi:cobalt-zinc-cadmium efflux system protein [Arthrobacter stackebrandtii]|uniref:Cobalt-zinc-cadmium efflux system protein n=1 Tax=Arthrobacter stackebrandtii TaxID=272161 RepID=A0ABS4YVS8_9MICC|nr:cation diffusion facilitator family transporter [Arthrobacter stackebrandtii]MBP2412834.1 cobalt-zinc-cadmium efflux system protein [Arthrobacter stackebrandtii]PYH01346.1 cation transporter [Arthrobacter stackebrandtii]